MTDEAINAEDLQDDNVEAHDDKTEVEIHDSAPRGYMTKDAWIAAGKDPEEWVSPEVFKERGEHIKKMQALKHDFDNQIKNMNLFHQIQLKNVLDELNEKRDNAIDIADKAEVKRIDRQIKELHEAEKLVSSGEVQQQKSPEIIEWEQDNPWCQDPEDPRLELANRTLKNALKEGKTLAGALRLVDKEINAKFSSKNSTPRQIVEGSRAAGGKRSDEPVTMATLSAEEKKVWDTGIFSDEKAFLKAVANDRKGTK